MIVLLSVTAKVPALLLLRVPSQNLELLPVSCWRFCSCVTKLIISSSFLVNITKSSAKAKYLKVWLRRLVPCKSQDR
eukprot:maker-scaffold_7-snap-gene-18.43-mRNA-1 protein AED:0.21 eAED:0.21 QI:0/0.5/0/1/0/0/3/413/76